MLSHHDKQSIQIKKKLSSFSKSNSKQKQTKIMLPTIIRFKAHQNNKKSNEKMPSNVKQFVRLSERRQKAVKKHSINKSIKSQRMIKHEEEEEENWLEYNFNSNKKDLAFDIKQSIQKLNRIEKNDISLQKTPDQKNKNKTDKTSNQILGNLKVFQERKRTKRVHTDLRVSIKEQSDEQNSITSKNASRRLINRYKYQRQYESSRFSQQLILKSNRKIIGERSKVGKNKQGSCKQTEFSKRILINKGKLEHENVLKFLVPRTTDFQNYLLYYEPLDPNFNLKQLSKQLNFKCISYGENVYFGQLENNQRNGRGLLINQNFIFQGIFKNDQKLSGKQKNADGLYTGEFKNGNRNGKGKFQWNNGQIFEGDWVNNKKSGKGLWISANGEQYEGQWLNNRQYGHGTYKSKNSIYKGSFINFMKEGSGQQVFKNGDKYKGQYKHGKPHGVGRYDWSDGTYYLGQFEVGYRQGKGMIFEPNGCYYKGYFMKDLKHGYGIEGNKINQQYEGQFIQGRRVSIENNHIQSYRSKE